MKISKDQLLFGIPDLALQDALRKLGNSSLRSEWFSDRLGISDAEARHLLVDCSMRVGLHVKKMGQSGERSQRREGGSFIHTRATRLLLQRSKADALLKGALQAF